MPRNFSERAGQSFLSTLPISMLGTDMFERFGLSTQPLIDNSSVDYSSLFAEGVQTKADIDQIRVDPTFAPDIVPGTTASTVAISVGGSAEVSIDTLGDRDFYRVTLTAGVTYTIQTSSDGAGTDAFLNIRDSVGTLLTSDDDSGDGNNSLVSFTPTTSGTYFIDAGTYNNATTGTYHLFVAADVPAGDVVGGTTGTAGTIALGGTTNGNIDTSGDHDFYAINLVAGQTYMFRTAPTSAATTTTDTVLTLRDAAGTQLATNDDAGEFGFSAVRYTATTSGTYYLDVSGFGTATGAFNLSVFTAQPLSLFTNDQIAYQLTNNYWGGTSRRWNVAPGGSITVNLTGLTVDGAFLARNALALWTDATGISFSEVGAGGQIVFDDNQTGAFANSTVSGGFITAATVNVGTAWLTSYGVTLNTYSWQTYVHEIGHALGLGHGGNYNGSASYSADASYLNDAWVTTIMSYFDPVENTYFAGQGFTRQYSQTPMIADLVATTSLYGTATTTRTGDTIYGFNNNSGRAVYNATTGQPAIAYTVVDHGGIDTLDYSGYTQTQRIDLNSETFSDVGGRIGNVSIARGTVIENAIGGSGTDTIIGNGANNILDGGAGISFLTGAGGDDRLILRSGANGSTIDGGTGTDTLVINNTVTSLASLANIEALEFSSGAGLTLTGTQFNNGLATFGANIGGNGILTVNMDPNVYYLSANQIFSGSVTVTVNGTSGDDVIKAGNAVHTINAGDGFDFIRGGTLGDTINGGLGDDKIYGYGGADILTGGGGVDQFRYLATSDSGFGAASDRITDFTIGTDKLDFRLFDADPVAPGYQPFSFVGTSAFTGGGTASIRYAGSGADLLLQVDVNGDGISDMEIVLQGLNGQTLTSGDFLFV